MVGWSLVTTRLIRSLRIMASTGAMQQLYAIGRLVALYNYANTISFMMVLHHPGASSSHILKFLWIRVTYGQLLKCSTQAIFPVPDGSLLEFRILQRMSECGPTWCENLMFGDLPPEGTGISTPTCIHWGARRYGICRATLNVASQSTRDTKRPRTNRFERRSGADGLS